MPRLQQVIDSRSGEVLSSRTINGNLDFVQISRSSMPATRDFVLKYPRAFALFWYLVEQMDKENALIISRETLAELQKCSVRTITRQLEILKEEKYIDIVKSGVNNVYLINASIAWTSNGDRKQYARFRAQVIVSEQEQNHLRTKASRIKQLNLLDDNN